MPLAPLAVPGGTDHAADSGTAKEGGRRERHGRRTLRPLWQMSTAASRGHVRHRLVLEKEKDGVSVTTTRPPAARTSSGMCTSPVRVTNHTFGFADFSHKLSEEVGDRALEMVRAFRETAPHDTTRMLTERALMWHLLFQIEHGEPDVHSSLIELMESGAIPKPFHPYVKREAPYSYEELKEAVVQGLDLRTHLYEEIELSAAGRSPPSSYHPLPVADRSLPPLYDIPGVDSPADRQTFITQPPQTSTSPTSPSSPSPPSSPVPSKRDTSGGGAGRRRLRKKWKPKEPYVAESLKERLKVLASEPRHWTPPRVESFLTAYNREKKQEAQEQEARVKAARHLPIPIFLHSTSLT